MKTPFSKNVCGLKPGKSGLEGCDRKKALKPAELALPGVERGAADTVLTIYVLGSPVRFARLQD